MRQQDLGAIREAFTAAQHSFEIKKSKTIRYKPLKKMNIKIRMNSGNDNEAARSWPRLEKLTAAQHGFEMRKSKKIRNKTKNGKK